MRKLRNKPKSREYIGPLSGRSTCETARGIENKEKDLKFIDNFFFGTSLQVMKKIYGCPYLRENNLVMQKSIR